MTNETPPAWALPIIKAVNDLKESAAPPPKEQPPTMAEIDAIVSGIMPGETTTKPSKNSVPDALIEDILNKIM